MKKIQKLYKKHNEWLSNSQNIPAREQEYLDKYLYDNNMNSLQHVADSLGFLASFYGKKGLVAINDGISSGWEDASKAIHYRYWALKIFCKTYSKTLFLKSLTGGPNLTNEMSIAGNLLACFIAIGKDDMASFTFDLLVQMVSVKGVIDEKHLQARRFEFFILWLYSISHNIRLPHNVKFSALGVYQEVINCWECEKGLESALMGLCNYHLANMVDYGGNWDPEFKKSPFDLLPLEIRAIYVVREKMGLSTPNIAHPLLNTPAASVENLTIVPDQLINQVESVFNSFFNE